MTTVDAPTAAERSALMLKTLSATGAINNAIYFCEEPWVQEAARRKGGLTRELLGVYWLWGSDDETRHPAAVVRVARVPWRASQRERTTHLALYFSDDGDWRVVCFDQIVETRKLFGLAADLVPFPRCRCGGSG